MASDRKNSKPDKKVSKRDKRKYIEFRQKVKKGELLSHYR